MNANNPQWINQENGKWTFTGEILDNIPQLLQDEVESVYAPNTTRVALFGYLKLESLKALKAKKVEMTGCRGLTKLEVPSVTDIRLFDCPLLTTLDTPNVEIASLYALEKLKTFNQKQCDVIYCQQIFLEKGKYKVKSSIGKNIEALADREKDRKREVAARVAKEFAESTPEAKKVIMSEPKLVSYIDGFERTIPNKSQGGSNIQGLGDGQQSQIQKGLIKTMNNADLQNNTSPRYTVNDNEEHKSR